MFIDTVLLALGALSWFMAETAEAFLAKAKARESGHGAASGAHRASSAESVASTYIEGFTNHEAFAEDFYQGQAQKQKRIDEKKVKNNPQCPSQPNNVLTMPQENSH